MTQQFSVWLSEHMGGKLAWYLSSTWWRDGPDKTVVSWRNFPFRYKFYMHIHFRMYAFAPICLAYYRILNSYLWNSFHVQTSNCELNRDLHAWSTRVRSDVRLPFCSPKCNRKFCLLILPPLVTQSFYWYLVSVPMMLCSAVWVRGYRW